jgi:hypothetical protein
MRRPVPLLLAFALLATGCNRDRESQRARAVVGRALPDALAYPGSSLVSFSAGEDAAQIELSTPASLQEVAAWYRAVLPLNGWEVRSDAADRSGAVIIYAEKGTRPMWLTLRANVGGPGTTYTLMGAVVEPDSTKVQRSGSSMSSNRIQRR